jgi:hypothetical protein
MGALTSQKPPEGAHASNGATSMVDMTANWAVASFAFGNPLVDE